MGYIDKSGIFIKGLSFKFVESSGAFSGATTEQKNEYFRQYEVLKNKFYRSMETTADPSDIKAETDAEYNLLKHRVLNENNFALTPQENLLLLKKVVEAELSKKELVLSQLSDVQEEQAPDDSKDVDTTTNSLFSIDSIEGMSASAESGKISKIKEKADTAVSNYSPTVKKDKENSLDEDAFEYILETINNINSPKNLTSLDQSIINDSSDLNIEDDTRVDESFNVDTASYFSPDISKYITTMWTRYNTNDDDFRRLYPLPEKYNALYEIEAMKDIVINTVRDSNIIEKMLGVLEEYNKEAESTLKLSVNSSVFFLKDWNVVKNERVLQ